VLNRHAHRLDLCFDEIFSPGVKQAIAGLGDLLG